MTQVTNQPVFDHTCQIITDFPYSTSFKYKVFKELWKHDFFVTTGQNFGGDFLAYPGDPLYYHASHIIHIAEDGEIEPLSFIGKQRLTVTVNKIFLVAYEDEGEVIFKQYDWVNPKGSRKGNTSLEAVTSARPDF